MDPSQLRGKRLEKARRTVILKHMFTPEEMDADPGLLIDLKEDVRGECERKAGEVTTVQIYDRHREGK